MMVLKASDVNKAKEITNKMSGFNEPEKIDHTTGGSPIIFNYKKPKKDNE